MKEEKGCAVWLLLTRHTTHAETAHETKGSRSAVEDFLTAHVFKDRGGYRVYYLETAWMQVVARRGSSMRSFYESYRWARVTDIVPTNHLYVRARLYIHVSLL